MAVPEIFISSGEEQEWNYLEWRSRKKRTGENALAAKMKAWLATAGSGDSGNTQSPAAAREEDVRQQAKSAASCCFTDLWRLNENRKRNLRRGSVLALQGICGEGACSQCTGSCIYGIT